MENTQEDPELKRFSATPNQKLQLCNYYKENYQILNQEYLMSAPRVNYLKAWEDFEKFARR